MDDTTRATQTAPKRPYRTPELRDLGFVAELTQTQGGPAGTADGATNYTTS